MVQGICKLSMVPVRKEPTHRSEMVNQLLFADTYTVLNEQTGWLRIVTTHDDYEGWINSSQHFATTPKELQLLQSADRAIAYDLVCTVPGSNTPVLVTAGSTLPAFDGLNFRLGKERLVYNGKAIPAEPANLNMIEKLTNRFLGVPYLWGGRSPFGIDCSGFTQVVFKYLGVALKRDAYQQAEQGSIVNFINETQPGDLAFFANEEGKITHVGIVLKDQQIIHASGVVRVDRLDHFGIFNTSTNKYTHQLKIIKRLT